VIDHAAALSVALELAPVPPSQVVSGTPLVGVAVLGTFGAGEYGVWELSPGAMSDVETDEVFVVLSGAATVEFLDEGITIELAPGSVGRLRDGARTIWTVTQTLRKIWVA